MYSQWILKHEKIRIQFIRNKHFRQDFCSTLPKSNISASGHFMQTNYSINLINVPPPRPSKNTISHPHLYIIWVTLSIIFIT